MQTVHVNAVLSANGQKLNISTEDTNTLAIQVVGAMSATVAIEGTIDGRNWFALNAVPKDSGAAVTSFTAAGVWFANVSGLISARLRCSAYTSGSPTLALVATMNGYAAAAGVNGTVIQASENFLGAVGGKTIIAADETTRVADVNAYAAGDSIGATVSDSGTTALRSIAVARVAAGSGYITRIRLRTDQIANVARIRLHFYTVAAPTTAVPGDNVAFTTLYANNAQLLGSIDMPAFTSNGGSSTAATSMDITSRLPFVCASADSNIYYRLETLDAFTPASGQKFHISLAIEQN